MAAFLAAGCGAAPPAPPPAASTAGEPAYVGTAACAPCHADLARRFARTGMGRSLYPMTPASGKDLARFPDALEVPRQNLRYAMSERDGSFYVRQYQNGHDGAPTNVDERRLDYVLGSGNHSRSFITSHAGRLYQVPVCWYPQAQRWDLCPGYEVANAGFSRGIDDTCLACHNGRVRTDGRFGNRFEEPFPHGIDCERCHGPGSHHVAWASSARGARAQDGAPAGENPRIVNPGYLPDDLKVQVCMQCHLGDSAQSERVHLKRDHMESWRPGRPLQEAVAVYAYREPLEGPFGLAAQADRLALSRCYTASAGRLQCITCHNPHDEVYEVSRAEPGRFNAACTGCHAAPGGGAEGHPGRDGDCVGCHMRRAEPHDHPHTTFLDHWIRRRPDEGTGRVRSDFTLIPFFGDHDRHGTEAERALWLGRAYFNKKTGSVAARAMPWELAEDSLEQAARLDPGLPGAPFYLGKVAMARGDARTAEQQFRRAAEIDPDYVDAIQEMGSALLALGRLDEAAEALQRALELGPRGDDEGAVLNELARVEMQRGRLDEAGSRLEEALAVEPLGTEIHANLGVLASLRGDHAAAVASYRRALQLQPNEPTLHRYLAEALAARGPQHDPKEAVFEARLATRLAPRSAAAWQALAAACRASGDTACATRAEGRAGALRGGAS